LPTFPPPGVYLIDTRRQVRRGSEETPVPRFLFSYRVPVDYQPSAETAKAWQAWFESPGSSLTDPGHGVLATRALGNRDADTRLGGYSAVSAEDREGAAALAKGCPALRLGGGAEIGTVPGFTGNPRAGTGA
jgi:hypothetical protein